METGVSVRVLIAEDHAFMRESLRELLMATSSISVVADVDSGREAVRRAAELEPDVLVTDISMPDLDGLDAASLVRARCPRTKIIMLSMHASIEHVCRALRAGATGYVLKECAAKEIVSAVQTVHAGQFYFSRALGEMLSRSGDSRPAASVERDPFTSGSGRGR